MKIWRISNHADLSGIGGKFSEGRWNHLGTEIVYCSDHPSTCMLEMLVRFDPKTTPERYQMLEIQMPKNLQVWEPKLKDNWQKQPKYTRDIWSEFCATEKALLMKVPSVILRQANNYLLNPRHIDHGQITIEKVHTQFLDKRFYG